MVFAVIVYVVSEVFHTYVAPVLPASMIGAATSEHWVMSAPKFTTGKLLMVTSTASVAEHPLLLTVTLYVPVVLAVIVCVVSEVFHTYVAPVLPASMIGAATSEHWVMSAPKFTNGTALIVTSIASVAEQPLPVTVTLYVPVALAVRV